MRREADATVLAFDFGTRRIGVAMGNTLLRVATEHAMTVRAREFAHELADRFALPVAFEDERHTSETARDALAAAGRGSRAHRGERDRVAAQIILQAWFDEHHDA
jgi:putative Holliday junction resolvase